MIAYSFPPEGSAGAHRPLRFARSLSRMGWRINVISSDPISYERYDPDTSKLIPEDANVVRVRVRDPWQLIQSKRGLRIQKQFDGSGAEARLQVQTAQHTTFRASIRELVRTAEAWCYHPDMAMPWIRPAVKAALETCRHETPSVIWATAGPVSSFVVAERVSQRTGVPYVLDFRDAWTITDNDFENRRPLWATLANRRAMFRMLKKARAVVFLYESVAECYWNAYRGALDPAKIHIIPNGYEGPVAEFGAACDGHRCTVLYTGTLSSYRYDTLLQSLCLLKESEPDRARRLRLLVVGEGAELLAAEAEALGLSDMVETRGATSRAEIGRLQRQADALLILGRHQTMKGHELFVGAKLFEYLKAGRPVIGVLPSDETQKLLHRVGVTTVADVDSPSDILAVLRSVMDAWSQKALQSLVPDPSACEVYSVEPQTEALIRALEGLPSTEPFVPGRSEVPASLRREIGHGNWLTHSER